MLTKVIASNSVMPQVFNGEAFCDLLGFYTKILECEHSRWQHMVLCVLDNVVRCEEVVHWDGDLHMTAGCHLALLYCEA